MYRALLPSTLSHPCSQKQLANLKSNRQNFLLPDLHWWVLASHSFSLARTLTYLKMQSQHTHTYYVVAPLLASPLLQHGWDACPQATTRDHTVVVDGGC